MARVKQGNYLGLLFLTIAIGLFVSGGVTIWRGLADQRAIAETKDRGDIPIPDHRLMSGHYMDFATPTVISIPSISLTSPLITVGKAADGSIDTPKTPDFDKAAW